MTYQDLILYVMSGTGNTFRVAQWIKEMAEQRGTKTEVMMIDDAPPGSPPENRPDQMVGIMFPAHGLMAPWSMIKFLFRMPMGKSASVVCISTRGGIKLGPIVIPGAVGIGNFMAALILLIKGYRIKGLFSLDMPVNMINLHWGMHPKNIAFMLDRARKKLSPVVNHFLDGNRLFFTRNNLWEAAWGGLLLWLLPLFPILYLLIGRIFMGKLMFSDNRCIGCGLCVKFCPNHGIVMKKVGNRKRPYWTYHCEACLRCMSFCKREAIQAGHSWAVVLYFITSIPVFTWLTAELSQYFHTIPVIEDYWIGQLVNYFYIFPSLILSYWLFWILIRIPQVNTLFSYTTLTRYFRRYHEPGTRLKNLKKTGKKDPR